MGFWPSERMTVPSSLVVMVPSPSLSKSENASLNSVEIKKHKETYLDWLGRNHNKYLLYLGDLVCSKYLVWQLEIL